MVVKIKDWWFLYSLLDGWHDDLVSYLCGDISLHLRWNFASEMFRYWLEVTWAFCADKRIKMTETNQQSNLSSARSRKLEVCGWRIWRGRSIECKSTWENIQRNTFCLTLHKTTLDEKLTMQISRKIGICEHISWFFCGRIFRIKFFRWRIQFRHQSSNE